MNAVFYSGFVGTIPKTSRSFFSSIFLNGTPGIFFRSFIRATHFNASEPPATPYPLLVAAYATLQRSYWEWGADRSPGSDDNASRAIV